MKKWIIFLAIVLTLPWSLLYSEEDHIGCQDGEIVNGKCVVAPSGASNKDLFNRLDSVKVVTAEVDYGMGIPGFIAKPKEEGIFPGVILIHEWWGLNENIKDMAKILADDGYVVLAVDLYLGESAETSEKAKLLSSNARKNPEKSIENMKQAVSYLRSLPYINPDKVASLGWCFGGQQSLNLAISGEKLAATIIYYGSLETSKEKLSKISWPVLGIFGETDSSIPLSTIAEFKENLDSLGIKNEIYVYPGVGHAFANPSGSRYAPKQTLDAWDKTIRFLKQNLK
jgi:carboxymethylenebutenolidase